MLGKGNDRMCNRRRRSQKIRKIATVNLRSIRAIPCLRQEPD